MKKHKINKVYGLILSLTGFSISINILPSLVTTFTDSLGVSITHLGFAFSIQYISFFICSLIYGVIIQRGHTAREYVIIITLTLTGITLFFFGKIHSYLLLLLLLIIIGGCGGLVESVGSTLIAGYERNGTSRYLNLSQFFYCLGAIISPAAIALLFTWDLELSILSLILGIFILLITLAVVIILSAGSNSRSVTIVKTPLQNAEYPHGLFKWYVLTMFIYVLAESSLASWIPTYFELAKGYDTNHAALNLTAFWIGLAAGRLYYSIKETHSLKKHMLIHCLLALICTIAMNTVSNPILSYTLLVLIGISCGPIWPMLLASCRHDFSKSHLIMYLVSTASIGALSGPLLTSLLFNVFSISSYFSILGGILILALIGLIMLNPRKH